MRARTIPHGERQGAMIIPQAEAVALCKLLEGLYQQQAALGTEEYLLLHARPDGVKHQVNVFAWYAPLLPETGTVLDWGCYHGPDTCLLRKTFGERLEIHACDFSAESQFRVFREYGRPHYRQLTSPVGLPY